MNVLNQSSETAEKINNSYLGSTEKAKKRRGNKLRRLNNAKRQCTLLHGLHPSEQISVNKATQKQKHVRCKLIAVIVVMFTGILCYQGFNPGDILSDFVTRYTSQYMSIMHNKINYCDHDADMQNLFKTLRLYVLHQDEALEKLEIAMRNRSNVQKIVLVGSSGIGKSLTARLLREQFPWPENANLYYWNSHIHDDTQKFADLKFLLKSTSRCGRNLLIIDNMSPFDRQLVSVINNLVHKQTQTPNKEKSKHIIILYIINLNSLLPSVEYEEELHQLQFLPETNVIHYRRFGQVELAECIRNEMRLENIDVDKTYVEDILRSTDVAESGCKTVHAKVLIYGKLTKN